MTRRICAECGRDIDDPYARGVHPWCRGEDRTGGDQ